MSGPRADWDDDRLTAAFVARAAGTTSAPHDLASAAIDAIDRPRRGAGRGAWILAAATLVVAVTATGYSMFFRVGNGGPRIAPGATGTTTTGNGPATDPVLDALGQPISVSAALQIGRGEPGDREVVVAGFLSSFPAIPCPAPLGPRNPTKLDCPLNLQYVMEQPEHLGGSGADGSAVGPPKGPAFHVSFAIVDAPSVPFPAVGGASPVAVVLTGHFHDRRAAACEPARQVDCGETFLVDRVDAVQDEQRIVGTIRRADGQTAASECDIDGLVRGVAPSAVVLSRQLVGEDAVAALEPAMAGTTFAAHGRLIWIVTTVDLVDGAPRARTFLIVDGHAEVTEVTANGPVAVAPSPPPPATPVPSDEAPLVSPRISTLRGWIADHAVDVATVISRLPATTGDQELAVSGWAWAPAIYFACPAIRPGDSVTGACGRTWIWISEVPPATGPNGTLAPPTQPAIELRVTAETALQIQLRGSDPIQVVALVHVVPDSIAQICASDRDPTCGHLVISDAVLDPAAPDPGPRVDTDPSALATPDQVVAVAILGARGTPSPLSVTAVRRTVLPTLIDTGSPEPSDLREARTVWIVRFLDLVDDETASLETRLVVDGPADQLGDHVYAVTDSGLVRR